jgi:cytidine deaminase
MTTLTPAQLIELKNEISAHGGLISVQQVQLLLATLDCTIDQLMLVLVPLASEFAVAPISQFMVGAVVLGETGSLYIGANQEFGNISLSEVVHAEQAAVAVANHHGETRLLKVAINSKPCGHCRQFLFELPDSGNLHIVLTDADVISLKELLPDAFGPEALNVQGGMLSSQFHALTLLDPTNDEFVNFALQAAIKSYAPYTSAYSGAALRTQDGKIVTGCYLENVAFNPSLPAMQSAFVSLVMSGYRYEDVVEAVLVQVKESLVDQAPSSQLLLRAACPAASLRICETAVR